MHAAHCADTQGIDQPGSDEHEHNDYVEPRLNVSDATVHVRGLREYAMAVPDKFGSMHVKGLDDMMSKLVAMSLLYKIGRRCRAAEGCNCSVWVLSLISSVCKSEFYAQRAVTEEAHLGKS